MPALADPVLRATTRETTFKRKLVDRLDMAPGQQALDIGCGDGTLAAMIAGAYPMVGVTGLDRDPDVLRRARAHCREEGAFVAFDAGESTGLPYENQSFDRVTATLFFHELTTAEKARTLAEVRRVLKPGGELHVADWTKPSGALMGALHWPVRLIDGAEATEANRDGTLPRMFERAGLGVTTEHERLRTGFGSLAVWTTRVPR